MKSARVQSALFKSDAFAAAHGAAIPAAGATLKLGDARGAGGFGTVHSLVAPGTQLAVKLTRLSSVSPNHTDAVVRTLTALLGSLENGGNPAWTQDFLALPFAGFIGESGGEQVLALIMLDLAALGYADAPFAKPDDVPAYASQSPQLRLAIAESFARKAKLLEDLSFVHGDLNPENVMISSTTNEVQIIDLETGAVVRTGTERPIVAGKPNESMPPEIKSSGAGGGADPGLLDAEAERWSVGSVVGHCLFGIHPSFFLRSISRAAVDEYAQNAHLWPEIDASNPVFDCEPATLDAYLQYVKVFRQAPAAVALEFREFFGAGSSGLLRPTATDWLAALSRSAEPPKVETFEVLEACFIEGGDVEVSWVAPGADFVEITTAGKQPPAGRTRVKLKESGRITLTAFNAFGSVQAVSEPVRVIELPRVPLVVTPELSLPPVRVARTVIVASRPDRQLPDLRSAAARVAARAAPQRARISPPMMRSASLPVPRTRIRPKFQFLAKQKGSS